MEPVAFLAHNTEHFQHGTDMATSEPGYRPNPHTLGEQLHNLNHRVMADAEMV
jgi:hypothetical protein